MKRPALRKFWTRLLDQPPTHPMPPPTTLTHMHSSLLCPSPHLPSAASGPPLPAKNLLTSYTTDGEEWTDETHTLNTSWLWCCEPAGDSGSGSMSGLLLGLCERGLPLLPLPPPPLTLLLHDWAEQSESEEPELECLTRLLCVCARCTDKLPVNKHKHAQT